MNGRVYDPRLSRFVSADPFIQAPDNLQSHNRYSYVFNNPLSATDPSGYFSEESAKAELKRVHYDLQNFFFGGNLDRVGREVQRVLRRSATTRSLVVTAVCVAEGLTTFETTSGAFCAAASASVTYIVTGDHQAAFKAGATAYSAAFVSHFIGLKYDLSSGFEWGLAAKNFTAHGILGGATSEIMGESFRSGFLTGFGAEAAAVGVGLGIDGKPGSDIYGPMLNAVVGGAISKHSGGSQYTGVMTALMGYIYNYSSQRKSRIAAKRETEEALITDVNSCSGGFLVCRVKEGDEGGIGYQHLSGGKVRKWGFYSCACESTGEEFYFSGPGYIKNESDLLGKNLLGVYDQTAYLNGEETWTGQYFESFNVNLNSGAGAYVSRMFNRVDATFIRAFRENNQTYPVK